jgi:hypothetical protein
MPVEIDIYRKKAQDAIEVVFRSEYHNSLGIPMPEVKMLLPDDKNYKTGLYYITIDDVWQIHLNFGALPISYKEFEDEVKVLTRHEIGHYMCCPFDVITHFRMLKAIREVYKREFSHLNLNINHLCASIANQAADIIVDTNNYFLYPQETLISEINWIRKGANIKSCPSHSKLMFLVKERIWQKSLGIEETDDKLLEQVNIIANIFNQNGISDKGSFLEKTRAYSRVFLKLYEEDILSANQRPNSQSSDSNSSLGNSNASNTPSSIQDVQHLEDNNEVSGQAGTQHGLNPQAGKPKDGNENGSAIVLSDPDKVKEAIEIIAGETNVQEFIDVLNAAGLNMTDKEKEIIWFSAQGASMIPIHEESNSGNDSLYTYPTTWKIGDAVEDLDIMLTLMGSPIILPGITTKKWILASRESRGVKKKQRDLLLVLDTSGSMGDAKDAKSSMHQAILSSYGLIEYFESTSSSIAVLGFSDRITTECGWTKDYNSIREQILLSGNGGTNFPIRRIKALLEERETNVVTVVVTDGELGNRKESEEFFQSYLDDDNRLYLFILGKNRHSIDLKNLKDIGAKVYQAQTAEEFCNAVISDID